MGEGGFVPGHLDKLQLLLYRFGNGVGGSIYHESWYVDAVELTAVWDENIWSISVV